MSNVTATRESLTLPTYGVGAPERNPAFFEKRVYQGSSGKVYPVPFIDKVFDEPEDQSYDSIRLENDVVRLVMLPEIGGRIYIGQDKTNDDYNFFYKNDVIKPALVGLAGPWLSGGVEFNWPQHHRPGTFMPTDVEIEEKEDGSKIVWMSEHDPINRLKGMHGIKIKPNSGLIELKARLYNRTSQTQTFLWWANVAAEVHDQYQSFFPADVNFVADHAGRAMSSFPEAMNDYYGIDYHNRPGANDLTEYKNIPVPTSYMVCQTNHDFFGGYDYNAKGGFVHVANRHISPGKKQWTWGNDEFGWAWDRELTDDNGPYVELMAGVYTDNQPDFTYLKPGETKTFSQFWWGYKYLGPLQNANTKAGIRLVVEADGKLDLGVAVPETIENAQIILKDGDRVLLDISVKVSPEMPWQQQELTFEGNQPSSLEMVVMDGDEVILSFRPVEVSESVTLPDAASEPAAPEDIETVEELYLTGEHLELYRHPTCYPETYWNEALRRDPKDSRCNISMGRQHLQRGQFKEALGSFSTAIERLTRRHPNPVTGEAHYYLGLTLNLVGRREEAYKALYKSTWSFEWRSCGFYELACLDLYRGQLDEALKHLDQSLVTNADHNKATVLKAIVLRQQSRISEAQLVLENLLVKDPLDHWALFELGQLKGDQSDYLCKSRNDAQTALDLAFDYAHSGCYTEAIALLELHESNDVTKVTVPNPLERSQMTTYTLAWLQAQLGEVALSQTTLERAKSLSADYFFPSRLQEQIVLEWVLSEEDASDGHAAYALGNYWFDRKVHEKAISAWELSRQANPQLATVHRNLGIAYWNVRRDGEAARQAYALALQADPKDARLLFEYDQLCKKLGHDLQERLNYLLERKSMVLERDDCSVELANLYNQNSQPELALELLLSRRFHPWEGGEGQVLKQYTTARLLLGQKALEEQLLDEALSHFQTAMKAPLNLGEAYHLLQAKADVNYWIAKAFQALGQQEPTEQHFEMSAGEQGDFQAMAVTEFSELSYHRGLSLLELGEKERAMDLFGNLKSFAEQQCLSKAKIDYFATSLPLILVFEDDLDDVQRVNAEHLIALAEAGLEIGSRHCS
jgi:tetratricopeptide (TPR) repeat protein